MKIYSNAELTWKDLIDLPVNAAFYEIDLPTNPVFIKAGDCQAKFRGLDIRVFPLHPDNDGNSRLGLYEMDEPTRSSKRWHRLTEQETEIMIGRLMLVKHPTPK